MTSASSQPLVSVHMPVLNGEPTIETALASLFVQSHENWEAIVVNDGSTDSTRAILESFQDARIRVINLPANRGRAYARQVALNHSVGEFIAYLDSDDLYHPKKLERQIAYFSRYPDLKYCGCGFGSLDREGALRRVRSKKSLSPRTFRFGEPFPFAPVASMLKADIAKRTQYNPSLLFGEDIDYLRRALNGCSYGAIPEVLYFYSEHESVTKKKILMTYLYELKASWRYLPNHTFYAFRSLIATSLKLIALLAAYPVASLERIIDSRGKEPSTLDIANLEQTKATIYSWLKDLPVEKHQPGR